MELSAYALERKNVRMLNFACLAASLLLTAGVGAGYVSTPSRHNAPQLVNGVTYYGYDADALSTLNKSISDLAVNESSRSIALYLNGAQIGYSDYPDDASNAFYALIDFGHGSVEEWGSDNVVSPLFYPINLIYGPEVVAYLDLNLLVLDSDFNCNFAWVVDDTATSLSVYAVNAIVDGKFAYVPSYEGTDVTDAITDGLGGIVPMGGALVTGFDAIALDDGALTPVVTFGFVLMGLGISVGIVKKCFNWVTGRHGM